MTIINLPSVVNGFVVFRQVDGEYWFYGEYDTEKKAKEVAEMIGGIAWQVNTVL